MGGIYRELTSLLKEGGSYLLREGRGSHEIWFSPRANRAFTVPANISSRHLANEILKQAGLPKGF
ncbi:MAG: type II toxin-antitoxin system HicA family toxin [Desulfarculus sp.]|nr:type II toxin-antitoxin system HicA family toxin [Desulfarculus sp.]